MALPTGEWRLTAILMILYQLSLFFAAQLIFVIFLEYMPKTNCDDDNYCYKLKGKCISNFDPDSPNLCEANGTDIDQCINEKSHRFFDSAQLEYQQSCDPTMNAISATTAMYLGGLVGNMIFGILADRLGRRPIFFLAISLGVASLILSAAIPGITAFYIFRVLTGVGVTGVQIVGWSYMSEMIAVNRRFQLRTFPNWGNARILVVSVAFLTQKWRIATYTCAAISSLILPILWYLPESPVFLEQKKKLEKATNSRMRLAEICGTEFEEVINSKNENLKKISFFSMFRMPRLRRNFFVLCFMWFYVGMATYITDLNGGDMSSNFYFGQVMSGVLLTVSKIIFGSIEPSLPWLGRRVIFLFSQGTAIIAYVIILIFLYFGMKQSIWYTVVYLCAYSFQALSTETCYLSLAELMPTDIRTTVGAIMNILLRLGTILASTTIPLKYWYEPALFWINLVVCSIGITVVYLYLEESRNANLKNVGQDEEDESRSEDEESEKILSSSKSSGEKTEKSEKTNDVSTTFSE